MKKRLTLVTTVCGRFFYFYEKNVWLCNQLLMTEGQSYSTSASYVTWPSTWHLRGLNLPSSYSEFLFRIQYFFAHGFLGIKCHIFEVLSSSSYQWTSFLFKKCVYQLCFLCFLLFHEAQRGLTVSWERRLAFLLDENVHRYITFGQASIILKFNRKKIKNKQRNRSKYDKFFPITASCEAGRMFTSKRQMKPAAVMDAQDGTP